MIYNRKTTGCRIEADILFSKVLCIGQKKIVADRRNKDN
jgi:hypothetical protein